MSININLQQIVWSPGVSLDAIEQQVIIKAYHFFQKNKTQTALALGISVRGLDHKLERYEKEERDRAIFMEEEKRKQQVFVDRQRGFVQPVPEVPFGTQKVEEAPPQAQSEPLQVTTLPQAVQPKKVSHPSSK